MNNQCPLCNRWYQVKKLTTANSDKYGICPKCRKKEVV